MDSSGNKIATARRQPKLETSTDRELLSRHWHFPTLLGFSIFYFAVIPFLMSISNADSLTGLPVFLGAGLLISWYYSIAIFLALFPVSFLVRVVLVSVLATIPVGALFLGNMSVDQMELGQFFDHINSVPILVAGMSLPFLGVKHLHRWRLKIEWLLSDPDESLTIASMLIATGMLAFCFALLTISPQNIVLIILCITAAFMGLGFVFFVPFVIWVSRSRRKALVVTATSLTVGLLTFLIMSVVPPLFAYLGMPPFGLRAGLSSLFGSLFFWLGIAMLVADASGITLETRHSKVFQESGEPELS